MLLVVSFVVNALTSQVEFSHELSSVQEKFDMCYDAISQHLNNLRHHIYRVDRDSSGMLRVMRSLYDITERNVEQEVFSLLLLSATCF